MAKKTKSRRSGPKAKKAPATQTEMEADLSFRPFEKLRRSSGSSQATPRAEEKKSAPRPAPQPMPGAAARDKAASTDDTAETFAAHMAGVKTLPGAAMRIPATASSIERGQPVASTSDPDANARDRLRALVSDGVRFEVTDDGEVLEGRRLDIDPRELRRLRRGEYGVDGKLDLHGLTADEAREASLTFIRARRTRGDRVVLIVHGKGSHSPRGVGVLRGEIGAWLSQGRGSRDVAAFTSANRANGGTGAVLVLLAR